MVSTLSSFETSHEDMIHDAQMDYYGRRLATCSSDRTIRIFEVEKDTSRLVEVLQSHDGPVWQVAWAHPKFGSILASCSYDGKVIFWRESGSSWEVFLEHRHDASVNAISWAPYEFGLSLACASSDAKFSVLTIRDNALDVKVYHAHPSGCNAVSWAPALSASKDGAPVRRIATGGCDNLIKIWRYNEEDTQWTQEGNALEGHSDWIRDLSWAQYVGGTGLMLASCSQDKQVLIWTLENDEWKEPVPVRKEGFAEVVWRVSWSVTGTILAVSSGDNKVTLFKQAVDGSWENLNDFDDAAAQGGVAQ